MLEFSPELSGYWLRWRSPLERPWRPEPLKPTVVVAVVAAVRTSRVVAVELTLAVVTLHRQAMRASRAVDVRPTLAALTIPARASVTAAVLRPTLTTRFPLTALMVGMRLAAGASLPVMPAAAWVMVVTPIPGL